MAGPVSSDSTLMPEEESLLVDLAAAWENVPRGEHQDSVFPRGERRPGPSPIRARPVPARFQRPTSTISPTPV